MTTPTTTPSADIRSPLTGVNVLLMGPAGTGKTYSIGRLVEMGLKVRYLALEPGLESLLGYFTDKGKPVPDNLAWHHVEGKKASFAELRENARKVNTMSFDALSKLSDPNRSKYDALDKIFAALNGFIDQRTGKNLGCADEWGTDCVLVMDGMAGLARAAMENVIGGKPVPNQAEWGLAQKNIEGMIHMITNQVRSHFVMLAHVERETDQVLGGTKIMLSSLGKALGPKLPPMFSDVILAARNNDKFTWDTGSSMADVKSRNLPINTSLPADFGAIINKWTSRGGLLENTPVPE